MIPDSVVWKILTSHIPNSLHIFFTHPQMCTHYLNTVNTDTCYVFDTLKIYEWIKHLSRWISLGKFHFLLKLNKRHHFKLSEMETLIFSVYCWCSYASSLSRLRLKMTRLVIKPLFMPRLQISRDLITHTHLTLFLRLFRLLCQLVEE